MWTVVREKLGFPADATREQVLAGVDVLQARAKARDSNTVSASSVRGALGLSDADSHQLVLAAIDGLNLRIAKKCGVSASADPVEIRAALAVVSRAHERVEQQVAA